MQARNHILVPIDFSNESLHALEYAIKIANSFALDIRLIHVKRQNADYDSSFNLHDFDVVLKAGIIEKFEKIIAKQSKYLLGTFDYKIREGRIYSEICNQAKYGDAELIIMGTHGISGFEERWMGSNAFRVVCHSDCPVVSTRYDFPNRSIKTIILPIDKSEETRLKVPYVAKLAKILNAKIFAIDLRETNRISTQKVLNEYMAQVMTYLERKKIDCVRHSVKVNNLSDGIIEHALINNADLIAIMNDRNEKSKRLILGQHAQHVVNHSPIPVMSFNSPS